MFFEGFLWNLERNILTCLGEDALKAFDLGKLLETVDLRLS